jgi:hypothetical protein
VGARGPGARPPRTPEQQRRQLYNLRHTLRRAELRAAGVEDLRRYRRLVAFLRDPAHDDLGLEEVKRAFPEATARELARACREIVDELEAELAEVPRQARKAGKR